MSPTARPTRSTGTPTDERRAAAVAVGVYRWADVVFDLGAHTRKTMLPDRLPQPSTQVDLADGVSRIFLYRSTDPQWAPASRAASIILTTIKPHPVTPTATGPTATGPTATGPTATASGPATPVAPLRVALLIDQSDKTRGLSEVASREVLPGHYPTYLFQPGDRRGDYVSRWRTEWVQTMVALAQWVRRGEVADTAQGWTVAQTRAWLKWFKAGITDPADRGVLEAAGARHTTKHRNPIELFTVSRLVATGMPVDEIARWLPHLPGGETIGACAVFERGLSFHDVEPYLGTRLDPTDSTRDGGPMTDRIEEIARTLTDGWTPQGRKAIDDQAPDGCSAATWADLWTQFMPAPLASSYAEAGVPFAAAVRLHLTGQDPDPNALSTLAALRT